MKRIYLVIVCLISMIQLFAAPQGGKRLFTDMNGVSVAVPDEVKKVYCTSPIGTYLVYCLKPEALLGWNSPLSDETKSFIDPKAASLPALGGTMGGKNTFNTEMILKLSPDLILNFDYKGESAQMVASLAEQTGLPVVTLHSALPDTPQAIRLLGDMLGVQARAKLLADYSERILKAVAAAVATIPPQKRANVYYAESSDGLKTDGADSMHAELLNFINARNAAAVESSQLGMGMSVSMEQVLAWDPEWIFASPGMGGVEFVAKLKSDPAWAKVSAVRSGKVHLIPAQPFNWFDRPPCVARILGVQWLGNLLYPDLVKVDMRKAVKDFYSLFFRVALSDSQVDALLATQAVAAGGDK
jgi:iron complex transport system substrate-binding protein